MKSESVSPYANTTRTAVRQAMHLMLGLKISTIAKLTGTGSSNVIRQIRDGKAWESCSPGERATALSVARAIVANGGD